MNDDSYDTSELITVLCKRGELVSLIADGTTDRRELKDAVDVSRTTTYRGLRQLVDVGILREENSTYQLTERGERIYPMFRQFGRTVDTILETYDVLEYVPNHAELPTQVFVDSEIELSKPSLPAGLTHRIERAFRSSSRVRGVFSVLHSWHVKLIEDTLATTDYSAELVIHRSAVEYLRNYHTSLLKRIRDRPSVELRTADDVPSYNVYLLDTEMLLSVYGTTGELHGTIRNGSRAAVDWTNDEFDRIYDCSSAATVVPSPSPCDGELPNDEVESA